MIKILSEKKNEYLDDFKAAAYCAARLLGQSGALTVSVCLVSEKEMKEINSAHRGIDKSTDVLSFPSLDLQKPEATPLKEITKDGFPFETDSGGAVNLGDIVICKSIALKQSIEYGHSAQREMCYLFIHGLLHLFGFDHMTESDKTVMRNAEESILINLTL